MEIIAVTFPNGKKRKDVLYGQSLSKNRLPEKIGRIMRIKKGDLFNTIMMLPDIKIDDPRGFKHVLYVQKENGDIIIYRRSNKGLTEVGKTNGNEKDLKKIKRDIIEAVMLSTTEMGLTDNGQKKFLFDLRAMVAELGTNLPK